MTAFGNQYYKRLGSWLTLFKNHHILGMLFAISKVEPDDGELHYVVHFERSDSSPTTSFRIIGTS